MPPTETPPNLLAWQRVAGRGRLGILFSLGTSRITTDTLSMCWQPSNVLDFSLLDVSGQISDSPFLMAVFPVISESSPSLLTLAFSLHQAGMTQEKLLDAKTPRRKQ